MASISCSNPKGIVDDLGLERCFYTSEILEEKLFILTVKLSEEEQTKMTRVHQSEVPPLVTTKMDSFPVFYVFPQSYTHCSATTADLDAMLDIFKEDNRKVIKWPTGENIAHCPHCGHSDVYIGRFCIEPMAKSYFESSEDSGGGLEPTINVSTHYMPRIFHEKCFKQLAKQALKFGVVLPNQPEPKSHNTITGYDLPLLTEQWVKVQKLVRGMDRKIRLNFIPESLFGASDRKQLNDAICLEKFLKNLTYQNMVHIADTAGMELEASQEDFESSSLFPSDAQYFRNEGNRAISSKDYPLAINFYSKSVIACPSNYVTWSQRSIALTGLKKFEESLQDSEECIKLNPKWIKGYLSRALAQLTLEWHDDALVTLIQAGNVDPADADVAKKLLTAVNLSYSGNGITHFVKVVEDERYERLHIFLTLVCKHICKLCGITEEEMASKPSVLQRNMMLDRHQAARLAYRLSTLDLAQLKKYTEIFKDIAGSALNDVLKSAKKGKKATKGKAKGKQTSSLSKKLSAEKDARLAALEKRENDVLRQLRVNREKDESSNSKSIKKKSVWIAMKKSLTEQRKYLNQELEIIRKCHEQIKEDTKKGIQRRQSDSTNVEINNVLERQNKIPCSKRYTPDQLKALPWQVLEKAESNGMLNETELEPSNEELWKVVEPFSASLACGTHSPIGAILAEYLLGSYRNAWQCLGDLTGEENLCAFGLSPKRDDSTTTEEVLNQSTEKPGVGLANGSKNSDIKIELASTPSEPYLGLPSLTGLRSIEDGLLDFCLHIDRSVNEVAHHGFTREGSKLKAAILRSSSPANEVLESDEHFHDALSSLDDIKFDEDFTTSPEDIHELDGVTEILELKRNNSVEHKLAQSVANKKMCAHCCQSGIKLSKCGNCLKVYYCSKDCQRLDRKLHKKNCQRL